MLYQVDFDYLRRLGWPIDTDSALPPGWILYMDNRGMENDVAIWCQDGHYVASIAWSPKSSGPFAGYFNDTSEQNDIFGDFSEPLAIALRGHVCKNA